MKGTIQRREDEAVEEEMEDIAKEETPLYPSKKERRLIILPMVGFTCLYYIGVIGWATLLPQYILDRLRKGVQNVTITTDICHVNVTDPLYLKEKKLEQEASEVVSAAAFCAGVPAMITVIMYSSISDQLGRKVTIAIPYLGGSIVSIVIAVMVSLDLPFWMYLAANFLNGLSGSYSTMVAGVFASVADITPPELRSVNIAIVEGSLGLAMLVANLLVGFWARNAGYAQPIIFLASLIVCSGGFFFFIRETRPRSEIVSARQQGLCGAVLKQLRHIGFTLVRDRRRMKKMLILATAFMLTMLAYMGASATLTLYVMGQPFCWNSGDIGTYNALKTAVIMGGAIVAVIILRRWISDLNLAVIGAFSAMGLAFLTGFASFFETGFHNVVMIIAVVAGLLTSVPMITLRGLNSSLVSSSEQGALFGLMAIGECFSVSFGPVIMNGIYAATVTKMSAFIYFFTVGLLIIMLLLLLAYKLFLSRRSDYEDLDESVSSNVTQSINRSERV